MAVKENEPGSETPETPETPKPKNKLFLWLAVFLVAFLFTTVGNYLYLKTTYVPPPTPLVEEEKPVLTIDLGDEEIPAPRDTVSEFPAAQALAVPMDTSRPIASLITQQQETTSAVIEQDSLPLKGPLGLANEDAEGAIAKLPQPIQKEAKLDSSALRKTVKLAKIVENMPPEDAAKMLEPLSNDMVIDILLRLKQRQAAKIMAEIPSERAAQISRAIMEPLVQR